jgi:hypothetical protein
MPRRVEDFRGLAFDRAAVDKAGKSVGRTGYWKLYAIENLFRVLIHSVLSAQIGPKWWTTAVAPNIQKRAQHFRQQYVKRPWHTSPGAHDIYYTLLSDLSEIIRANSNLFQPVVPDIDQWIARIEQLRLPRNIVGHMNYPSQVDQQRIDVIYKDTVALIAQLQGGGSVTISIP